MFVILHFFSIFIQGMDRRRQKTVPQEHRTRFPMLVLAARNVEGCPHASFLVHTFYGLCDDFKNDVELNKS